MRTTNPSSAARPPATAATSVAAIHPPLLLPTVSAPLDLATKDAINSASSKNYLYGSTSASTRTVLSRGSSSGSGHSKNKYYYS